MVLEVKCKIFLFFLVLSISFFYFVKIGFSQIGILEVNLSLPLDPTNVIQNDTFTINATVFCRDTNCANVYGTARYNLTSQDPDTPINTTQGDKPFFVNETPALALKPCPTNPLAMGEFCNLTWEVNVSGDIGSVWKIGVFFNSSSDPVENNHTKNSTVSLIDCTVDFSIDWPNIDFGNLDPNTQQNAAPGNSVNQYNITVNPGSCKLDLYINSTNLTNQTLSSEIDVSYIKWNNNSNSYATAYNMSSSVSPVRLNSPKNNNVTTWYWVDVPPIYAAQYNGTIYIYGVESGEIL